MGRLHRVRRQAIDGLQRILEHVFEPLGRVPARRLAGEGARFALAFVDGCFLAHHIDPDTTDLRRLFALLRTLFLAYSEQLIHQTRRRRDE